MRQGSHDQGKEMGDIKVRDLSSDLSFGAIVEGVTYETPADPRIRGQLNEISDDPASGLRQHSAAAKGAALRRVRVYALGKISRGPDQQLPAPHRRLYRPHAAGTPG